MITIIDYGMGNLHSVSKAVERLDYRYIITSDPEQIRRAQLLILPGVGAFGDAVANLRARALIEPIKESVGRKVPILGICLGMQLLFHSSEEHGYNQGLGFLPGTVIRFVGDYKIPHMGWNKLVFRQRNHPLFAQLEEGYVYFVHSYMAKTHEEDILLATSDYYQTVPAVVGRDHIIGMQFHPEKSGEMGMQLLERFLHCYG